MNALRSELIQVEAYSFGILFCVVLWLYLTSKRASKATRIAQDVDNRVKVIECWPNQNDRIKDLEKRMEFMEKEMDALRHNSFTGETLRRVK